MIHLIFWFYILSILLGGVAVYSAILLYQKPDTAWVKPFIGVLSSLNLILLIYAVFFFLFAYTNSAILTISMIESWIMLLPGSTLLLFGLLLFFSLMDVDRKRMTTVFSLLILCFFICIQLFEMFVPEFRNIGVILISIILLALLAISIRFIDFRRIYHNPNQKILVFLLSLSLFFIPLEWLEMVYRKSLFSQAATLPQGMFSFSVYLLILNISVITHSHKQRHKHRRGMHLGVLEELSPEFIDRYSLTARESEVLCCLMNGSTHKEAAFQLGISPRTIGRHCNNIYAKTGAGSLVMVMKMVHEDRYQ